MKCQECGAWGYTEGHHKVPKGRDKRGLDFPANLIRLCIECHYGDQGPHKNRQTALRYMREVKDYLRATLTDTHYMPDDLIRIIELPVKQAYQVVRLLQPEDKGYRTRDLIYRLLGNRHDWVGEDEM